MRPEGPVLIVGAGLLGTSTGLALRRAGVDVALSDLSERHLAMATSMGAGNVPAETIRPAVVVVAVPPDHLAAEVVRALKGHPQAVVTDVGSVKAGPLREVRAQVDEESLARYVGSHPMAGSERSGPAAAAAALFDGRPWAVTPHPGASAAAVAAVTGLAETCGATPVPMGPEEHDEAVARISHLPHLLAALAAGRLADAPRSHLALSGQGVRDVTRIAAGDPSLWQQIVAANSTALSALLRQVRAEVDVLLGALEADDRDALGAVLRRGTVGTSVIPAKHGGPQVAEGSVYVAVPDHPGELARLFADAGEAGVNIEDIRIDHDPGRPVGLVELFVAAEATERLLDALADRGWTTHR